jgi:hypothetical protein
MVRLRTSRSRIRLKVNHRGAEQPNRAPIKPLKDRERVSPPKRTR